MREIDPISLKVLLLEIKRDEHFCGSATGFFYKSADNIFVITNRHVVIDESQQHYPNKLSFVLHKNLPDYRVEVAEKPVILELYHNETPNWLEHPANIIDLEDPQKNNILDVVAIKVTQDQLCDYRIETFSKEDFPPANLVQSLGDPLIVLGYPLGMYDRVHNLPIAKGATIASSYGVGFDEHEFFLIDSTLREGTSGSPVITKDSPFKRFRGEPPQKSSHGPFLLGVMSAGNPNVNLNKVWYSDVIEEILTQRSP